MANTVTTRTLIDGPRHTVVHVYLASDGSSGELTDRILVDASTLIPVLVKGTIEQVWWDLTGFTGLLNFDATTPVPVQHLAAETDGFMDYRSFGGVKDNSGTGSTGDITLTTTGFAAAGDRGTIVIKIRKD